jgi:hypothetical protein
LSFEQTARFSDLGNPTTFARISILGLVNFEQVETLLRSLATTNGREKYDDMQVSCLRAEAINKLATAWHESFAKNLILSKVRLEAH